MKNYKIVNFAEIEGVSCPCGIARRALSDVPEFPGTIHRTSINKTAKPHYHKKITEVYYILSCGDDSAMILDGERFPLYPNMLLYIPPETLHCLDGTAEVLLTAIPKFDPQDEFISG